MKKLQLLLPLLLLTFFSVVLNAQDKPEQSTGIVFEHGSWNEILSKAKSENKLIFLDAFADWCGPCKWMAKNIFPTDSAGKFYNRNFINAKIDMEKGEGIEIAKKYGVTAFPTFLYIDGNGELIHRTCGSVPLNEFVQNGMDALDPQKQLSNLRKNFNAGKPDAKTAYNYLTKLQAACMNTDEDLAVYLKTLETEELKQKDNWNIIFSFLNDPESREFKYISENRKQFTSLFRKEVVDNKITNVYSAGLINLIRKKDMQGYEAMKKQIKQSGEPLADKIILNSDMVLFQKNKDWKNYASTASKYVDQFGMDDYQLLNSTAWTFYERVDDKEMLSKAAKWAKRSVELNPQYANYDTYAAVLTKLGRTKEAEQAALKAIELGKKEGADVAETEKLLSKIHAQK